MPFKSAQDKLEWQRRVRALNPGMRRLEYKKDAVKSRLRQAKMRGKPSREYPFIGVDGEGGGKDELGRQLYLLLRAGDNLLFDNNRPLSTDACLGFLSGLDTTKCYVAYYFDYDVTMILRDATHEQRQRIMKAGFLTDKSEISVCYVGDYQVAYLPRKYFKVRHKDAKQWVTINDVGNFFQCKFQKALEDWKIATPEQLALITKGKAARADFELMTDEEIEYNRLEVEMLARLMEEFRTVCINTGYVPSQWQGPGFLATAMLKKKGIVKREELYLPDELWPFANAAYYGGRFELLKIGSVSNVFEYDINSAYPTAMAFLPCLEHGRWEKGSGDPKSDDIFVASLGFRNWDKVICNLPVRDEKTGSIYWPREGNGIYWSWEIAAAQSARTEITDWRDHWVYHRECDCVPFKWVREVYAERKRIGKGTKGYSLKLAINSLYGKTAQSIGSAPYANPVWAGLITAFTRAKLIETYRDIDSRHVVMLATDGIYTMEPLDVPLGEWLGEWEMKQHEEMFFIAPGLYFYGGKAKSPKTRGVPRTVMEQHEDEFRTAFAEWMKDPFTLFGQPAHYPSVTVPLHAFVGMKLATHWNKPNEAGKWVDVERKVSFDFRNKREFATIEDGHFATFPRRGGAKLVTNSYKRRIGRWRGDDLQLTLPYEWEREAELWNAVTNGQPDHIDFAEGE